MKDTGIYEILSRPWLSELLHPDPPNAPAEHVSPHYHEKSAQAYTVTENRVEAQGRRILDAHVRVCLDIHRPPGLEAGRGQVTRRSPN